jgi:uncharacterized protein YjbJ (UPF0337 family)
LTSSPAETGSGRRQRRHPFGCRYPTKKEIIMSASDKIHNAAEDLAGKGKEALGKATDNDEKVAEGRADQSSAAAKKAGENVKDIFKS